MHPTAIQVGSKRRERPRPSMMIGGTRFIIDCGAPLDGLDWTVLGEVLATVSGRRDFDGVDAAFCRVRSESEELDRDGTGREISVIRTITATFWFAGVRGRPDTSEHPDYAASFILVLDGDDCSLTEDAGYGGI